MKLLKARPFNPGDKKPMDLEPLVNVSFNVYKFNPRPKPSDPGRILIIPCFSEFGCESIALLYCLPRIIAHYPGAYVIAVGWYGREYLYKHLVDEYWEVKEEYQWLREYSRAFDHESKNLERIEKWLKQQGQVYPGQAMGNIVLGNNCRKCDKTWEDNGIESCPKCSSTDFERSLFGDVLGHKKNAVPIPLPGKECQKEAEKYVPHPKTVGIFARGRKCYGRNLPPEFYARMIELLESKGYKAIWLGEKQSVIPCPVSHVVDFSRMPESKNLELTLAILARCEFTIQFWTASTRLAAMVGTPYLLFESPDQIAGQGQEGFRMALTTDWNKKKLVLSHYLNTLNNPDAALGLVSRAVDEMSENQWDHVYGLLEEENIVRHQVSGRRLWEEQC